MCGQRATEAREACMMGDYFLRKSESEEEIEKAKSCYQQAIDRDPLYADAFAGMAFTYFSLGGYGRDFEPSQEIRDKVRMLIQQALEIDPDNVRAHMVLGGLRFEWNWDWAGAEEEFQKVLRINPNHIETLNWYSELKMIFRQFDKQLMLVQKAHHLNPLDMVTLIHLYRYNRSILKYRCSLQFLDRIDELYPGNCETSFHRAWVYILLGQCKAATINGEKALSAPAIDDVSCGFLACASGKAGRKGKTLRCIPSQPWR